GNVCAMAYVSGSSVNLTASPQSGAQLLDWGGDCSSCGRNSTCNITLDGNKNCFVTFYAPLSIDDGRSATVGLQSSSRATQYSFNSNRILPGLALDFVYTGTDYTVNSTTFRYRFASSSNPVSFPTPDDSSVGISTPFPLRFYGTSYSQVYISTNGVISFGSGTTVYENTSLPNSGLPSMIAAFWDDLYIEPYSKVYWHVEGVSPNRVFVITYENVRHAGLQISPSVEDGITFQVVFYESEPNRITLQYADTRFFGTVVAVSKLGAGDISASTGNLNCGNACSVQYGFYAKVRLTANASQGSSFSGWAGDCSACGNNVSCDVEVNKSKFCLAQFTQTSGYTLTVNRQGSGSGTVVSNPQGINCGQTCSASFNQGTQVTLTANPAQNSVFVGWSGDCSGCGNSVQCQITMNSDKTCNATFNIRTYTITVERTGQGTITAQGCTLSWSGNTGTCSVNHGSSITLTAIPAEGYTFVSWSGACSGSGNTCTLSNITENKSVSATFNIRTYTITVERTGQGTITAQGCTLSWSGNTGTCSVNHGSSITLTAIPAEGYTFVSWSGACSGSGNTCTLSNITENKSVSATFNIRTYTITVERTGQGTITAQGCTLSWSGNTGTCSVNHGSSITLTAIPAEGYTFVSWSGACSGSGNTCTLSNITENKSVGATFNTTGGSGGGASGGGGCSMGYTENPVSAVLWVLLPALILTRRIIGLGD
ncbi:MAG: InlB B-repeat-containing protein, partial [Aquificaceae bacterium]|nr:InlB B-repeat-containing protein [Aquificaceae bacterium]